MSPADLLALLLRTERLADAKAAVEKFEEELGERLKWEAVGGRNNNVGTIQVAADPGRSVVERLTNGIDAVLESQHDAHHGIPDCRSPRDAAIAWLAVPPGGLSALSVPKRRILADMTTCTIHTGEGPESRIVEVRDTGIGMAPKAMPETILSLNEDNKLNKHYLAGLYGQGGSSTFAVSQLSLIASRYADCSTVGFTVVQYLDLDPEQFRTGRYAYLTLDGGVLEAPVPSDGFPTGTLVRHYGYDLSKYPNPLGEKSVYGLLNRVLFDPILPVFLDNATIATRQRRVIKGARNALNGAVDEGDEAASGPKLSHHMPLSTITLGDWGTIALEYWVLEPSATGSGGTTRAFVLPTRPIILTLNGQNHDERSVALIAQDAELPYLRQRLICNVNCDGLTGAAKRALFVSTREGARHGLLSTLIDTEVVRALRSDDELARLNDEAAEQSAQEQDEQAVLHMRREVAKILRVHGLRLSDVGPLGGATFDGPTKRGPKPRGPRKKLLPLEIHDPPTYVKILWDEDEPIPFYPGLRRYLRIQTDANSTWHDPTDVHKSRFNVIVLPESGLLPKGTTALVGGRMRVMVEASPGAAIGTTGMVRIELARPGLPTLSAERPTIIVKEPEGDPQEKKSALPEFQVRPVDRESPEWNALLGWPDDVTQVASHAELDKGVLVVYYSKEFPKFEAAFKGFERTDVNLAQSYRSRYEIWLAVHSLLLWQDQQLAKQSPAPSDEAQGPPADEETASEREQQERVRIATLSSLFAAREVKLGGTTEFDGAET